MKPLNRLGTLAILFLSFQSCKKSVDNFVPPVEATFIRTLDFPNQNYISKSASYSQPDSLNAYITYDENYLRFIFQGKKNSGKGEDAVVLEIPKTQLHLNFKGMYFFGSNTNALQAVRHTYGYNESSSSYWANITELSYSNMAKGQLEIDYYDATTNRISGNFSVKMVNLFADPTQKGSVTTYDPLQKCNMIIVGTFRYLPLPQ